MPEWQLRQGKLQDNFTAKTHCQGSNYPLVKITTMAAKIPKITSLIFLPPIFLRLKIFIEEFSHVVSEKFEVKFSAFPRLMDDHEFLV